MKLALLHAVAWIIFVAITAIEGALMVPLATGSAVFIVGLAEHTAPGLRLVLVLASLAVIGMFVYTLRWRASWWGCVCNVIAFYLWFVLGYIVLRGHF